MDAAIISLEQCLGRDERALCQWGDHSLHAAIVDDWQALCDAAAAAGFELAIASAYRSFSRQLSIWNGKVRGERAVLDGGGQPIDLAPLSPAEQVFAILRWSALPGGSRHHWGSDLDIYDRAALPPGDRLQLTADEVERGGPFYPLHCWLDQRIAAGEACGFYRPYRGQSAVAEERWHISHRATAARYSQQLSHDVLYNFLAAQPDLLLRDAILDNFERIFSEYIAS